PHAGEAVLQRGQLIDYARASPGGYEQAQGDRTAVGELTRVQDAGPALLAGGDAARLPLIRAGGHVGVAVQTPGRQRHGEGGQGRARAGAARAVRLGYGRVERDVAD